MRYKANVKIFITLYMQSKSRSSFYVKAYHVSKYQTWAEST